MTLWTFLKNLLRKWSCIHQWERYLTTKSYIYTTVVLRCPGCGALSRMRLEGDEVTDPHVTISIAAGRDRFAASAGDEKR